MTQPARAIRIIWTWEERNGRVEGRQVEQVEDVKRWTAKRKSAVVLDLIKGKATAIDVARKHDLTLADVEGWVQRFLAGGEAPQGSAGVQQSGAHYTWPFGAAGAKRGHRRRVAQRI